MSGFKIGSIRGIPIKIHFTFLLVLPLLAFAFSRVFADAARLADIPASQLTGTPLIWGLGLALALFLSVLLHELAHSLYALAKGGKVRDITLMMVGGVSQIAEMPSRPRHEAMMAFVGPLASVVIGLLLYAVHALIAGSPSFQLRFALFYLGGLNLFLGFFNLLPAFPMDGGRILRALLTPRFGAVRATNTAAAIGKVFAVLFGAWGLYTMNVLLIAIALFVYMGAESERRAVLVKSAIERLRVRDVMASGLDRGAPAVSPDDDAATALKIMNETNASQLAVVAEDGSRLGSIDREDIVRAVQPPAARARADSSDPMRSRSSDN